MHVPLCVYCALTTEPWSLHDVAVLFMSDLSPTKHGAHTHKQTHFIGGLIKTYMCTICGRLEVSGNHKTQGFSELSEHVAAALLNTVCEASPPPHPRVLPCNRINCQLKV